MLKDRKFGLYDNPNEKIFPANAIAYDPDHWTATVNNQSGYDVTFKAIDKCITLPKSENELLNRRCDGMLYFNDAIIFVELKDRTDGDWLEDGEKQLRSTIVHFLNNYNIDDYNSRYAYIANGARPFIQTNEDARKEKFEDDTGFSLRIQTEINLL